eukprot:GHVL01035289.1.p1 GENE.GHVL01035289.1~~GHVL01035289.1.p1  ORF type:complete len:484 (+),score=176.11 GHVL01035289.1:64-1515(+)
MIQLRIHYEGHPESIIKIDENISINNLINDIKKIAPKGVPIKKLIYNNKYLDLSKNILFYDINNNDIIYVETEIIIQDSNNCQLLLNISLIKATVNDIKDKIEEYWNIPIMNQYLGIPEKDLTNSLKSLSDLSIKTGDIIYLGMQIRIKNDDFDEDLILNVEWNNTILDVKNMINKIKNIPILEQKLICFGNEIKDDKQLTTQSKIQNQSCIKLSTLKNILIKDDNNKCIKVKIHMTDKVDKLKEIIGSIENISDYNNIILKYEDTILLDQLQLCNKIQDDGEEYIRYIGILNTGIDEDIDNVDNIIDINNIIIGDNEILTLKIQFENKKSFPIEIHSNDTIKDLQKKIEKRLDIPINRQKLIDSKNKVLKESYKIRDAGLINQSIVIILECIQVMVIDYRSDKKAIPIDVFPCDTIAAFKTKIQKEIGINLEGINLIYNTKQLSDELTIGHYKIGPDGSVHMTGRLNGGRNIFKIYILNKFK